MANKTLDKLKKFRAAHPQSGNFTKQKGIFYSFEDGDNPVRLVGEFLEVKTHFIAGNAKYNDRGLCMPSAFQGEDRLPKGLNCLDWDNEIEDWKAEKTCPVCKLWRIAKTALKESGGSLEPQEKQYLEKLKKDTSVTTTLKWNVIDRRDPNIVEVGDDGIEKKIPGYKVANIGIEAWRDIDAIFKQLDPIDISGQDEGIDINIVRSHNGVRVCYSAQAVMEGISAKVTPLTEEEKAMQLHDLKRVAGKMVTPEAVIDGLHEDIREILEEDEMDPEGGASEPKPEPKSEEPAEEPKPEPEPEEPAEEPAEEPEASAEGDEGDSDPSDWECFGTCDDPEHPECAKCTGKEECVAEYEKRKSAPKKRGK